MSITKNSGRQELVAAYVDVALADLATGVAQVAIDLPIGAVVVEGEVIVTEAFNSTSTDVLDVGYAGTGNAYKNDANIHTTGLVALVPTGYQHTATTPAVKCTWVSGGGTPTTGAFRLAVRYFVAGRAAFSQG